MNIITIDPSLTSTAMVINDIKFIYTKSSIARTKKLEFNRWFSLVEHLINVREFNDVPDSSYDELEVNKFNNFDLITDMIINDISNHINHSDETFIVIEGYSFSSDAGPLIDLTTFGTLLRTKILKLNLLYNKLPFNIIAPTRVKSLAAQLTYPGIPKNKKGDLEYRNKEGMSGGSFKKHQMYKVLTENTSLNCDWVNMLREYQDTIMDMKSVPKPIEDINDAKIMYEIIKAGLV